MTDAISPEVHAPPRLLAILARQPFAVLALLGLLVWLPGVLMLPPLDRDESRFAEASRQMVQTGNLVDIRFGHVPRYKKPVGIYWLQAGATAIAEQFPGVDDHRIWTYRLPSLLGAIAAAWLTAWTALAFASAEGSLLAGLLMLGSVLLAGEAIIATTDAVLLACVVAVQGVLLRVWRAAHNPEAPQPSTRLVLLGWAALAAGVLVKFPIVPGVAIVTVIGLIAWDRQWRWLGRLKPIHGLVLTALMVSPWLIAIAIQSHGAFFQQSLGNDLAAKVAGGQESHGAPPGYFLALSSITFWPAILFVVPGIVAAIARRAEPAIRFLLVWGAGWWLVVEAVPTKLPHYVLPAYPALAILATLFILEPPLPSGWLTAGRWVGAIQYLVGLAALVAAPLLAVMRYGPGVADLWWLWAAAGTGALLGLAALAMFVLRRSPMAMLLSLLAALVLVPTLTAGAGPLLTKLWMSERLAPLVAANTLSGDPPPALAGFEEPSLVFTLGPNVVLTDGAGAADAGAKNGGLALIEDRETGAFLARLAELQADAKAQASVDGFNYSRGKPVHVTVYRVGRLSTAP